MPARQAAFRTGFRFERGRAVAFVDPGAAPRVERREGPALGPDEELDPALLERLQAGQEAAFPLDRPPLVRPVLWTLDDDCPDAGVALRDCPQVWETTPAGAISFSLGSVLAVSQTLERYAVVSSDDLSVVENAQGLTRSAAEARRRELIATTDYDLDDLDVIPEYQLAG